MGRHFASRIEDDFSYYGGLDRGKNTKTDIHLAALNNYILYCELINIALQLYQMHNNPHIRKVLTTDNHYEVLGVPRNANSKEIKKAYREMALKYHPDKNDAPQAKEVFNKLVNSYNILSDETQRKNHDASINNLRNPQPPKGQRQQRPEKNTHKETHHYKSHYYDQFREQRQSFYKPPPKRHSSPSPQSKDAEPSPQSTKKFKKPTMTQKNSFSRSQDRPKYRSSYVHKRNTNGLVLFLLFAFLIIWYFMPSMQVKPMFVFTPTEQYTLKLKTKLLKVPYFVKIDYNQTDPIPQDTIERNYVRKLQKQCEKSLNQKKLYQKMAQRAANQIQQNILISSAQGVNLKSCKKIVKLIKKHPDIKLTVFPKKIIGL